MRIQISVVIGTRNRDDNLKYCLASLNKQNYPKNLYEVIVVDYGGLTETGALVSKFKNDNFIYVRVNESGLFNESRSKNIGIRKSRGEIVICTNADIIFSKIVLSNTIKEFTDRRKDGLFTLRRRELPENFTIENMFNKLISKTYEPSSNQIGIGPESAIGDFQAATRKSWLAVKGYDERMIGWGAMDLDLSLRMKEIGNAMIWLDHRHIKIYHQFHDWRRDRPALLHNINIMLMQTGIKYGPDQDKWGQLHKNKTVYIGYDTNFLTDIYQSIKKQVDLYISIKKGYKLSIKEKNQLINISGNYDLLLIKKMISIRFLGLLIMRFRITIATIMNQRLYSLIYANNLSYSRVEKFAIKYGLSVYNNYQN